jgi:hypothetical protein
MFPSSSQGRETSTVLGPNLTRFLPPPIHYVAPCLCVCIHTHTNTKNRRFFLAGQGHDPFRRPTNYFPLPRESVLSAVGVVALDIRSGGLTLTGQTYPTVDHLGSLNPKGDPKVPVGNPDKLYTRLSFGNLMPAVFY